MGLWSYLGRKVGGRTGVLGMRRVTQVLTAADSAAAPATNVPICSLSNAKRISPNFIG